MGGFLTPGVEREASHTHWSIKGTFHTSNAPALTCFSWFLSGQKKKMSQCHMNKSSELVRRRDQLQPNMDGKRAQQRSDLQDSVTQFHDYAVELI